ncbi:MAG: YfhO family protein [Prevotella sp.]|jgi:uncharacterized membrane protein|nr:YfhO family protein [Prevotella sp.]
MESLKNGTFPFYIDSDALNNYGYATKWFYPDLLLLPFAVLGNLASISFAYKALIFSLPVLAGIFTFLSVKRIDNNAFTAMLAGLLYAFCAYFIQNLFTRSAIGEALAMTFIPLVFGGLYEIIKGDCRKWYIFSIGVSLIAFSHVLSLFLVCLVSLVFVAICCKSFFREKERFLYLIISGITTLLITGYFIYPMLEQLFSNTFYYQIHTYRSPTENAQSLASIIGCLSIDYIHPPYYFNPKFGTLLLLGAFLRFFVKGKSKSKTVRLADSFLIISILLFFCCTNIVSWNTFPLSSIDFVQFPWRLLIFTSFMLAVADACYLSLIVKNTQTKITVLAYLFFLLLGSVGIDSFNFKKRSQPISVVWEKINNENPYNQGGKEYIPAKVPATNYPVCDYETRGDKIDTKYAATGISNFNRQNGVTSFSITPAGTDETAELPLFYYKGYTARLNGKDIPVQESEHGLVKIPVQEAGHVEVYYGGTTLQKVSPFISILGILALTAYIIVYKRKKKHA